MAGGYDGLHGRIGRTVAGQNGGVGQQARQQAVNTSPRHYRSLPPRLFTTSSPGSFRHISLWMSYLSSIILLAQFTSSLPVTSMARQSHGATAITTTTATTWLNYHHALLLLLIRHNIMNNINTLPIPLTYAIVLPVTPCGIGVVRRVIGICRCSGSAGQSRDGHYHRWHWSWFIGHTVNTLSSHSGICCYRLVE